MAVVLNENYPGTKHSSPPRRSAGVRILAQEQEWCRIKTLRHLWAGNRFLSRKVGSSVYWRSYGISC
jgi:hypothetical protein